MVSSTKKKKPISEYSNEDKALIEMEKILINPNVLKILKEPKQKNMTTVEYMRDLWNRLISHVNRNKMKYLSLIVTAVVLPYINHEHPGQLKRFLKWITRGTPPVVTNNLVDLTGADRESVVSLTSEVTAQRDATFRSNVALVASLPVRLLNRSSLIVRQVINAIRYFIGSNKAVSDAAKAAAAATIAKTAPPPPPPTTEKTQEQLEREERTRAFVEANAKSAPPTASASPPPAPTAPPEPPPIPQGHARRYQRKPKQPEKETASAAPPAAEALAATQPPATQPPATDAPQAPDIADLSTLPPSPPSQKDMTLTKHHKQPVPTVSTDQDLSLGKMHTGDVIIPTELTEIEKAAAAEVAQQRLAKEREHQQNPVIYSEPKTNEIKINENPTDTASAISVKIKYRHLITGSRDAEPYIFTDIRINNTKYKVNENVAKMLGYDLDKIALYYLVKPKLEKFPQRSICVLYFMIKLLSRDTEERYFLTRPSFFADMINSIYNEEGREKKGRDYKKLYKIANDYTVSGVLPNDRKKEKMRRILSKYISKYKERSPVIKQVDPRVIIIRPEMLYPRGQYDITITRDMLPKFEELATIINDDIDLKPLFEIEYKENLLQEFYKFLFTKTKRADYMTTHTGVQILNDFLKEQGIDQVEGKGITDFVKQMYDTIKKYTAKTIDITSVIASYIYRNKGAFIRYCLINYGIPAAVMAYEMSSKEKIQKSIFDKTREAAIVSGIPYYKLPIYDMFKEAFDKKMKQLRERLKRTHAYTAPKVDYNEHLRHYEESLKDPIGPNDDYIFRTIQRISGSGLQQSVNTILSKKDEGKTSKYKRLKTFFVKHGYKLAIAGMLAYYLLKEYYNVVPPGTEITPPSSEGIVPVTVDPETLPTRIIEVPSGKGTIDNKFTPHTMINGIVQSPPKIKAPIQTINKFTPHTMKKGEVIADKIKQMPAVQKILTKDTKKESTLSEPLKKESKIKRLGKWISRNKGKLLAVGIPAALIGLSILSSIVSNRAPPLDQNSWRGHHPEVPESDITTTERDVSEGIFSHIRQSRPWQNEYAGVSGSDPRAVKEAIDNGIFQLGVQYGAPVEIPTTTRTVGKFPNTAGAPDIPNPTSPPSTDPWSTTRTETPKGYGLNVNLKFNKLYDRLSKYATFKAIFRAGRTAKETISDLNRWLYKYKNIVLPIVRTIGIAGPLSFISTGVYMGHKQGIANQLYLNMMEIMRMSQLHQPETQESNTSGNGITNNEVRKIILNDNKKQTLKMRSVALLKWLRRNGLAAAVTLTTIAGIINAIRVRMHRPALEYLQYNRNIRVPTPPVEHGNPAEWWNNGRFGMNALNLEDYSNIVVDDATQQQIRDLTSHIQGHGVSGKDEEKPLTESDKKEIKQLVKEHKTIKSLAIALKGWIIKHKGIVLSVAYIMYSIIMRYNSMRRLRVKNSLVNVIVIMLQELLGSLPLAYNNPDSGRGIEDVKSFPQNKTLTPSLTEDDKKEIKQLVKEHKTIKSLAIALKEWIRKHKGIVISVAYIMYSIIMRYNIARRNGYNKKWGFINAICMILGELVSYFPPTRSGHGIEDVKPSPQNKTLTPSLTEDDKKEVEQLVKEYKTIISLAIAVKEWLKTHKGIVLSVAYIMYSIIQRYKTIKKKFWYYTKPMCLTYAIRALLIELSGIYPTYGGKQTVSGHGIGDPDIVIKQADKISKIPEVNKIVNEKEPIGTRMKKLLLWLVMNKKVRIAVATGIMLKVFAVYYNVSVAQFIRYVSSRLVKAIIIETRIMHSALLNIGMQNQLHKQNQTHPQNWHPSPPPGTAQAASGLTGGKLTSSYSEYPKKLINSGQIEKMGFKWFMNGDINNIPSLKDDVYILNLDQSDQGGTHWTLFLIDSKDSMLYYIDSFGELLNGYPPKSIIDLAHRMHLKISYNKTTYQPPKSNLCGYLAIYLAHKLRKRMREGKLTPALMQTYINNIMGREPDDNTIKKVMKWATKYIVD